MARKKRSANQERSALDNPSIPLNEAILLDAFGGEPTSSGVRVNKDTALTYPAIWRCVSIISKDVAKLPLFVYRRAGSGKVRDPQHPAYRLLRNRPNGEMASFSLRETLQNHVLLLGNAYCYISRLESGVPVELIPLDPEQTYPIRRNGQLLYVTTGANNQQVQIDPSNMLHIKGLGFDGLQGYSVLQMAKESIGLGLAARKFETFFFSNNASPRIVIEIPGNLPEPEKAKLREAWQRQQGGLANAHKAAFLYNGMSVKTIGNSPKDAELSALREFETRDICNWFGVPVHLVGDPTRTAYASVEAENQSYLDHCLDHWLCAWEDELERKLLSEQEQLDDSHVIEFQRAAIVRADQQARSQFYASALQWGWMNTNEVRAAESLPERPDGDAFLRPLNMQTVGSIPAAQEPVADRSKVIAAKALRKAIKRAVKDAVRRSVKRLSLHATRAAKHPDGFLAWIDGINAEHHNSLVEIMTPAVEAAAALRGEPIAVETVVGQLVAQVREQLLAVAGEVTADDLQASVESTVNEWGERWPKQFAKQLI